MGRRFNGEGSRKQKEVTRKPGSKEPADRVGKNSVLGESEGPMKKEIENEERVSL